MKLICKCGNISELKTDNEVETFEFRNCEDGTVAVICKSCSEIVFINFKNK
jgi:phage terminase large subunit GpA-like protein